MRKSLFFLAILAFGVSIFTFCTTGEGKKAVVEGNLPDSILQMQATFVGTKACISCHQDIYKKYQHTGKGKSFYLPSKKNIIEKFDNKVIVDHAAQLNYISFWRDTTMFIAEFRQKGKDTIHYREEQVDFVIGSGNQTRSYIYEENGYFYEMPLTWYVKKQIWDLSPGYDKGKNSRFERPIGDQCMNCHNSEQHFVNNSVNKFTTVGLGMSCEKCHGAGSYHIDKQTKNEKIALSGKADRSIVNPARLAVQLQFDVCRQCHLEGITVPKQGKKNTDFRPGEPLNRYFDVFIPVSSNSTDYGFASHAERLQQSQCFIQSAGKLTCTSCHNPHEALTNNVTATYNEKCQSCHAGSAHQKVCNRDIKSSKENNCIGCHLGKSGTTDIPHVSSTDHFIRVRSKKKETAKKGFTFKNYSDTTVDSRALGLAYLDYFETVEKNKTYLDSVTRFLAHLDNQQNLRYYYLRETMPQRALLQASPESVNNSSEAFYLAELRSKAGLSSIEYYEKAAVLAPDNLSAMFSLAVAYSNVGQTQHAIETYQKLLRLRPSHAGALANLGFTFMQQGDLRQALTFTNKAINYHPDYVLARENRINILLQRGEIETALKYLDEDLLAKYPNNSRYKVLRKKILEVL